MIMNDCIFCSVVAKKIPANVVLENKSAIAFHDIHPAAPVHVLIIPKVHVESIAACGPEHGEMLADMMLLASDVTKKLNVVESGFRLVTNSGASAGQSVFHAHLHLLAGRNFSWPPG